MFVADNAGVYEIEKALSSYRGHPPSSYEHLLGITKLARLANTLNVKLEDCNQIYLESYWKYLSMILKRIETGSYIVKPADVAEITLLNTVSGAVKFPKIIAIKKYEEYKQERKIVLKKIGIPSSPQFDYLVVHHFCNTGEGVKDLIELAHTAVLIQKYNN